MAVTDSRVWEPLPSALVHPLGPRFPSGPEGVLSADRALGPPCPSGHRPESIQTGPMSPG